MNIWTQVGMNSNFEDLVTIQIQALFLCMAMANPTFLYVLSVPCL